jgi:GNAT superfamily N-acetyltransferase
VTLRELPPGDAGRAVDTVFAGLSARSRYLRFHSPVPRLSDSLRRQLAELDGRRRAALVAEALDHGGPFPIGIVRLADCGAGRADVAVAVVDAWQRRGVGRRLLAAAAELAERLGYTDLCGLVLPENLAMRGLIRQVFAQSRVRLDDQVLEFTLPLGAAAYTVTHEDVLADLLGPDD